MDGTKASHEEHHRGVKRVETSHSTDGLTDLEQVRRLVRLLDEGDVAELELKQPADGTRLLLRKITASAGNTAATTNVIASQPDQDGELPSDDAPEETLKYVTAHLVGIFHRWLKPRGGSLVAVGDQVKVGQLVGTIESLNIINEVESPIAGTVAEILVQEGQPVEYGQRLVALEPTGDEEEE